MEKLGIKHNNFVTGSLGLILNALKTMPSLVNLEIVIEEKDEEAVLNALPNLRVLNKIELNEYGLGGGGGGGGSGGGGGGGPVSSSALASAAAEAAEEMYGARAEAFTVEELAAGAIEGKGGDSAAA